MSYDAGAVAMVAQLKRLQSDLGRLNDMHMLANVEPEHPRLALLRRQLVEEHRDLNAALVDSAAARWTELTATAGFAETA